MKMRLKKTWDGDIQTIAFLNVDLDGNVLGEAAPPVTFDRRLATPAMRDHAERHGWDQKHGDCAAIVWDKKSGKSATVEEKRAAVLASVERFQSATNDWTMRAGPRQLTPEQELALFEALAKKLGKTIS